MPQLSKPQNDEGRLALLQTAATTHESDTARNGSYLKPETLEEVKLVSSEYETKLKN